MRLDSSGSNGDQRISYIYDANGNLTQTKTEIHNGSSWNETLKWDYTWNVRDQLTLAMKYENGSSDNAGSVAYEAAVAAFIGPAKVGDSAMSRRFVSSRTLCRFVARDMDSFLVLAGLS